MRPIFIIVLFLGSMLSGGLATSSFAIGEEKKAEGDKAAYLAWCRDALGYIVLSSLVAFAAGLLAAN